MGVVIPIHQSDKHLRDKIEQLEAHYEAINELTMQIYHLENQVWALEYAYDVELARHIQCMGRENIAQDLLDYTLDEEDRPPTAGEAGVD